MRRSARESSPRRLRVSRRPGASQDRRRFSRDQRGSHQNHPSGLSPSHAFNDYRGVPARPCPGEEDGGHAYSARDATGDQGDGRGTAMPLSYCLRCGPLAIFGGGSGMAPAGADAEAAPRVYGSTGSRGGSFAASLSEGCGFLRASALAASLSSGGGCKRRVFAV